MCGFTHSAQTFRYSSHQRAREPIERDGVTLDDVQPMVPETVVRNSTHQPVPCVPRTPDELR